MRLLGWMSWLEQQGYGIVYGCMGIIEAFVSPAMWNGCCDERSACQYSNEGSAADTTRIIHGLVDSKQLQGLQKISIGGGCSFGGLCNGQDKERMQSQNQYNTM